MTGQQLGFWQSAKAKQAPLNWSYSRAKRLRSCHRKYYYYHYESLRGRHKDSPAHRREMFVLRGLVNRFEWVGEVVHHAVEDFLTSERQGKRVDTALLIQNITKKMRLQYLESSQKRYREHPGRAFGLFEHEYDAPLSKQDWQQVHERMEMCLDQFKNLPLLTEIQASAGANWLALENYSRFKIEQTTIVLKPDIAWRTPEGDLMLVDWKTGKAYPDDENLQLGIYGLFLARYWGHNARHILGTIVYLESGGSRQVNLDPALRNRALQEIQASGKLMRKLDDRVLDIHEDELLAAFPQTNDCQTCKFCVFKRLCSRV